MPVFRRPPTWRQGAATECRHAVLRRTLSPCYTPTEREAFAAQIAELGEQTTLLVDTYDVFEAVKIGVELTQGQLGAVRLDSGDLGPLAVHVRELLDSLGATKTKIIVTSDLDEFTIAGLSGAPVDGYGVGTALVTGSGHPTCEFVYKLVARAESDEPGSPMVAVAKKSVNKISVGGRKYAFRRLSEQGTAEAEIVGVGVPPDGDANDRPLLVPLVERARSLERNRSRPSASATCVPAPSFRSRRSRCPGVSPSSRPSGPAPVRCQPVPTKRRQRRATISNQHKRSHCLPHSEF